MPLPPAPRAQRGCRGRGRKGGSRRHRVRPGDEVFGIVDLAVRGGANGEYAVWAAWAPKQDALSWEQAGGAAANVEAATCVLDRLKATAVTTLLIEGTAGGVGTVAIHLAAARGMAVIGTASARNQEFVATPTTYGPGLGERVTALALDGVDVVLDCTGSGSLPDLGFTGTQLGGEVAELLVAVSDRSGELGRVLLGLVPVGVGCLVHGFER